MSKAGDRGQRRDYNGGCRGRKVVRLNDDEMAGCCQFSFFLERDSSLTICCLSQRGRWDECFTAKNGGESNKDPPGEAGSSEAEWDPCKTVDEEGCRTITERPPRSSTPSSTPPHFQHR